MTSLNAQPLNIIFAGTPVFAAHHLQALIDSHHSIVAVYTQPDKPAGRGKKLSASPVKQLALAHELNVYQPLNLKSAATQQQLSALNADIMVVVAYGLLLPQPILDAPKYGCINVHGSILPRWRGAAPIQRAIEAGDSQSGVTIMQMDIGLDTGDMLLKAFCPIAKGDTSGQLHDTLAKLGPPALLEALQKISTKSLLPEKQDDAQANYAHKIDKSEALIDWRESAETIHRKICAFNPFPVCYTTMGELRIKIHRANVIHDHTLPAGDINFTGQQMIVGCGDQTLNIDVIQLPGKKPMAISDFLNGGKQALKQSAFDLSPLDRDTVHQQV